MSRCLANQREIWAKGGAAGAATVRLYALHCVRRLIVREALARARSFITRMQKSITG
jgi:hypothetical protein